MSCRPRCISARRSAEFAKADFKDDCRVDYRDVEILVNVWLQTDLPAAGEAKGDGPINFIDYAALTTYWLDEQLWPRKHQFHPYRSNSLLRNLD